MKTETIFPENEVNEMSIEFKKALESIIDKGNVEYKKIHNQEGESPKVFHTFEHLETMKGFIIEYIAKAIELSDEQLTLALAAVAYHDRVIEVTPPSPGDPSLMIQRHRGAREGDKPKGIEGNEAKSARLLEKEMQDANSRAGSEIFSKEQIKNTVWAIEATYPEVNFGSDFSGASFKEYPYYKVAMEQNRPFEKLLNTLDGQGITKGPLFFQPHLEKPLEDGQHIPREVLVVALADLGLAGLGSSEEFFIHGDEEMQELYANLLHPEVMERLLEGDDEMDKKDREKMILKFIGWLESQTGFAVWQSLRFEKIIYLLKKNSEISSEEEENLRVQFSHFVENIEGAKKRAQKVKDETETMKKNLGEKEAFAYIAREMHYDISDVRKY